MQRKNNKSRRQKKDPLSLLENLDSLTLSSSSHGTPNRSSASRCTSSSSSSSSSSTTWFTPSVVRGDTLSLVKKTPTEVLARIFSFLDPEDFAAASQVCREWHSVATDDYSWKAAFDRFYGLHDTVPRLSSSWRGEYIIRSHLLRKWRIGQGPIILYDADLRPHPLTHLSELPPLQKQRRSLPRTIGQTFLLHGSLSGIVTASDPTAIEDPRKGFHPELMRAPVQSLALHDGIIAFGQPGGRIFVVDMSGRRRLEGSKIMERTHQLSVTALFIPHVPFKVHSLADPFGEGGMVGLISAGGNGEVSLHDIKSGKHLGTFTIPGTPSVPMRIISYLDYDVNTDVLLAGTCIGEVWKAQLSTNTEFCLVTGTEYDASQWETQQEVTIEPVWAIISWKVNVCFLSDFKNDSVFVIRERYIRRHGLVASIIVQLDPFNTAAYTCAAIDPNQHDSSIPRLLGIGDDEGKVSIFNARDSSSGDSLTLSPLYVILPVPDLKVTALALNPLVIATGSDDGTAKVYSALDGTLLRTLCAPNIRRRRLRPPSPTNDTNQNSIAAISLTTRYKCEVRGVIAFRLGHIRYWDFTPHGAGIILRSRRRRRHWTSTKELKEFVDDEIERSVEERIENAEERERREKINGGIQEDEVALQVALMMSREEEERRQEFKANFPSEESEENEKETEKSEDKLDVWQPGRKISFGSTSGSLSPLRVESEMRLEDVATFRKGKVPDGRNTRQFEEDLDFAIRLSLAEQESREERLS